ncbi:MAG: LysE family translocator [Candidatus Hodarchaeota archaeon]
MQLADVILLILLGFSLAIPIGPVNIEMLKQTLAQKEGWLLGIITGLGAMSGDFTLALTAMSLGEEVFKSVIEISAVKIGLAILNIVILGYIAWNAWTTEITDEMIWESPRIAETAPTTYTKQFLKGFFLVITSPWSYFWWASFGSYLLGRGLDLSSIWGKLLAAFFFLSGIFVWVILFCMSLRLSRKLANVRTINLITKTSALLILAIALTIAYDAFFVL